MASKSNQTIPYGSYNHVGFDYLSPKTSSQNIEFVDAGVGGTSFAGIDVTNQALMADTISEFTSATGVTIDGIKLKDSIVYTDTVSEKTSAAGVKIDGLPIKDLAIGSTVVEAASINCNEIYIGHYDYSNPGHNPYLQIHRVAENDFRFDCDSDTYDVLFKFQNTGTEDAILVADQLRLNDGAGGYWTIKCDGTHLYLDSTTSDGSNVYVMLEGNSIGTAVSS